MPIVLLAGLPKRALRRRDATVPLIHIAGWSVEVITSPKDETSAQKCWPEVLARVMEIDRDANSDGVHIFAFDRDPKTFTHNYGDPLKEHHRVRLLPNMLIQTFGTADFNVELTALAQVEETWRNDLRPQNHTEPVILPEGYFAAAAPFNDVWLRVRDFDGEQSVEAIKSLISNFKQRYRSDVYTDVRGYRFDTSGPRHGNPRDDIHNWKYGMRLPNSFHFDLTPEKSGSFSFQCRGQKRLTYVTHCNIDAFGYEVGMKR